jgi:hypothetical protein
MFAAPVPGPCFGELLFGDGAKALLDFRAYREHALVATAFD